MAYEIWDQGNRLGRFRDEKRALEAVRTLVENDPGMETTLVLVAEDANGHSRKVAEGLKLAKRAGAAAYA